MEINACLEISEIMRLVIRGGVSEIDAWINGLDQQTKDQIIEFLEILLRKMKPHGQPGRPKKEKDAA